jgi:hypothetical protein
MPSSRIAASKEESWAVRVPTVSRSHRPYSPPVGAPRREATSSATASMLSRSPEARSARRRSAQPSGTEATSTQRSMPSPSSPVHEAYRCSGVPAVAATDTPAPTTTSTRPAAISRRRSSTRRELISQGCRDGAGALATTSAAPALELAAAPARHRVPEPLLEHHSCRSADRQSSRRHDDHPAYPTFVGMGRREAAWVPGPGSRPRHGVGRRRPSGPSPAVPQCSPFKLAL